MPLRLPELLRDPDTPFPPVAQALREPDGLLAWGGDLSPQRLLAAYRHGCFPWYDRGQPIMWWSPDPRMVLGTDGFHLSRSLRRFLLRSDWRIGIDRQFDAVISACAQTPRPGQRGTWILPEMIAAYRHMHALGHAHSVEVITADGELAGGIYGIGIGRMFFGESMFSRRSNGSKVALLALCRHLRAHGCPMIDCQMDTPHLRSLGAGLQPRERFILASRQLAAQPVPESLWVNRTLVAAAGLVDASRHGVAPALR